MRILVVEDDTDVSRYIKRGLTEAGHVVDVAESGTDGLAMGREERFDVLIVDRMLPGMDGITLIETLRRDNRKVPVLILSALGELGDRVVGLRAGGDDYLPKPFAFEELLARVEALARRNYQGAVETQLKVADLEMDVLSRKVRRQGQTINLQPREFRLLEYLMRHSGQGRHANHAAGERLGLPLRPADQCH